MLLLDEAEQRGKGQARRMDSKEEVQAFEAEEGHVKIYCLAAYG